MNICFKTENFVFEWNLIFQTLVFIGHIIYICNAVANPHIGVHFLRIYQTSNIKWTTKN